jgi:hypothetical protein
MLFAGWFHYHKAAQKWAWFQDVESMLNHHLAGLLGLGSLKPGAFLLIILGTAVVQEIRRSYVMRRRLYESRNQMFLLETKVGGD